MKSSRLLCRLAALACALLPASLSAQSLEDALDSPPDWTWTTSAADWQGNPVPGGKWAGQTAVTHDGVDAARSGTLPLFGTSRLLTTNIIGPGTVTFWRRHGRAYEQNPFSMIANGEWMGLLLPGGTWQPVAIDFPPGPGSLEFSWYNSDQTGAGPDNHAYVDEVAFVPTTGAPQFLPDPIPDLTVGEGYVIQPPFAVMGEKPMRLELTLPGQGFAYPAELAPRTAGMSPAIAGWPFGFFANPSLSGLWSITASNAAGVVTRTFNVTVVPAAPHSIWIAGPGQVWDGATLRLTANPGGTAPFTYLWKKDGLDLAGQTDQTLVISNFSAGDVAGYSVVVSNPLGSVESPARFVSLGADAPVLVWQSGDVDVPTWDATTLQVQVTGTPPFETAWRRDGAVVQSDPYALDGSGYLNVWGFDGAGVYEFTSTNGLGGVTSAPIVVQQAPEGAAIADAVDNRTVAWRLPTLPSWVVTTTATHDGTDAAALLDSWPETLRTAVKGPAVISFWWRVDGGVLDFSVDGVVEASLDGSGGDSGWQRLQWSLGPGWHGLEWLTRDWTPAAYLDEFGVLSAGSGPVIVSQPQGGDYLEDDTAAISVTVSGTGLFEYRLFKDGDTTPVHEAWGWPATTYTFNVSVTSGDEGAYWIEVTDSQGRSVASDDAVISRERSFPTAVNVGDAVGQPALFWYYNDLSVADGSFYLIRPWYRTRQDGVAPGADRSARTPVLGTDDFAAVVMGYDAGDNPARLRFWARVQGAAFADVFHVSVNGMLATPDEAGTATGASGETWTAYELLLPGGYSEVQFEVLADRDDVTAWLDQIESVAVEPPVITQQPVNLVLPAGESGGLAVAATSLVPVTYQWFKVGTGAQEGQVFTLAGQTNDTLTFAPAVAADAGPYFVDVSNAFGTTRSDTVAVIVTGPRPQITQPLQPQQLRPGEELRLEVEAVSSNGPLSYEWFRDGQRVQVGGAGYTFLGVTVTNAGTYRVDVNDTRYTVSSETTVTVAEVYYHLTVLPRLPGGSYAVAGEVNNAGLVAGYGDSPGGITALVWSNAVPVRLTTNGSPFNWAISINNLGVVAGNLLGTQWTPQPAVARWLPPYVPGGFAPLGEPAGPGSLTDFARINDAGVITALRSEPATNGFPRFAYRYTTAGAWEPLGPLTGVTPLAGATDRGWATPLDLNNAGVIVGLTTFEEAAGGSSQSTGWIFDPAAPGGRTSMDTLSPELALTPAQPQGWVDAVNDLGDIVARRYGAGGPTKLFLIGTNGTVTKLLEAPAPFDDANREAFNVDALNNRREMVGYRLVPDPTGAFPTAQRAALFRSRGTPPGGTPATLDDFALYDLNDLVLGGTGGLLLQLAGGLNDAGQISGTAQWTDGRPNPGAAFLLTPVTPYAGMPALAVDDVLVRRAGLGLRFAADALLRNDQGAAPLTLQSVAAATAGGGAVTDLGGGWYRYDPPAGPDGPDSFTYVVQAGDGSTDTGAVRMQVESAPAPAGALPVQVLPGGQVRVRFVGIPGRPYRIEAAPAVGGPWSLLATLNAGPTGLVVYVDTPPPGVARFYRMVP